MVGKHESRSFNLRDSLILSITVSIVIVFGMHAFSFYNPMALPTSAMQNSQLTTPVNKRLLFYNRPPKTGSTTVRIAMKQAMDDRGLVSAKCFNMIEWNEMALRTIVNRRDVDFYGCHTRLFRERFVDVNAIRGGNVTFMTSTRPADDIILSAYLQEYRHREIAHVTDPEQMNKEVKLYEKYVDEYPQNALFVYHGGETPLEDCPVEWEHIDEMRRMAERYEVVVDLSRPKESAAMVEAVTGFRPDFEQYYNERTQDRTPMLERLRNVNTTYKSCGNQLVHETLMVQFNIIKDRLMQNRCFDEGTATFELCDKAQLTVSELKDRTRKESFKARDKLLKK